VTFQKKTSVIYFCDMKEIMLNDIATSKLKKSLIIAKALAKDWEQLTLTTAEARQGEVGNFKKRDGSYPSPSVFIKTQIYKTWGEEFISLEEAISYSNILGGSLHGIKRGATFSIKTNSREFGILEVIKILNSKKSPFENLKIAYDAEILGSKFGI